MARIVLITGDPDISKPLIIEFQDRAHEVSPIPCEEYEIKRAVGLMPNLVVVDFSSMGPKAAFACQRVLARVTLGCSVLAVFGHAHDPQILNAALDLGDSLARKHGVVKVAPSRSDYGFMSLDVHRREAVVRGKRISLTPTETHILSILASNAGKFVASKALVEQLHGYQIDEREAGDIIRVHIHNLRRKLEGLTPGPPYIVSSRGRGYMLERRSSPTPIDLDQP